MTMTNPFQDQLESPDRGSFLRQLLTADIAVLLGALIGLGVAWRDPGLAHMAIDAGVGAVIGFVISRFLRTMRLRTRLIALAVILLAALPVIGAMVFYGVR
jgi:hypothetical protein